MNRTLPNLRVSPAAWEASERIRRAKERPSLLPMFVDPRLAHLSLQVDLEPQDLWPQGLLVDQAFTPLGCVPVPVVNHG